MEARSRSRIGWAVGGILAAMMVVAGGAVVFWPDAAPPAEAQPPVKRTRPPTPLEQSTQVLTAQADALMKGDEKGWLAPIDPAQPKLRARYQAIFRNLRALDVAKAEYHAYRRETGSKTAVTVNAHLAYGFSAEMCPSWRKEAQSGPNGADENWFVAYTIPLNSAGADVVLNAAKALRDRETSLC